MARRPQPVTYREAIVTFIDILGFRELVANGDAETVYDNIERLKSFGGVGSSQSVPGEASETRSLNFSDSIIRMRYFDFDDGEGHGAIFYEALNLVHAQADLINQGIFVRGGLTAGSIFAEGTNVFGPAFVRAYELESNFASFPRIVVGPEVFHQLRSDSRLAEDVPHDVHYLRRLLRRGDDGLWFIDYLKSIRLEMDDPQVHPDFLLRHKAMIVTNAAQAISLRTLQKYLWLATYHNQVCNELYQAPELLVLQTDLPSLELLADVAQGINPDFD